MEKILSIDPITEKAMAGYAITTDKQVVKMLIDDDASCCESWGYFLSEDNPSHFVGTHLLNITITDTALTTKNFSDYDFLDMGGVMFVNIETDKGVLQFVAYNAHNGYYGHEAKVISEQINHSEIL
jgi:hypothetical protein